MLDIKFIRENKDLVKDGARKKRMNVDIDRLIALDDERRTLVTAVENRKAEQNRVSDQITAAGADPAERTKLIESMRAVKEESKKR